MSAQTIPAPRLRPGSAALLGALGAAAAGALTAWDPSYAIAFVIAGEILVTCFAWPDAVPGVLAAGVVLEGVPLGPGVSARTLTAGTAALAVALLLPALVRSPPRLRPLATAAAAFAAWACAATLWADPRGALGQVLAGLLVLVALGLLVRSERALRAALAGLVVGSTIVAAAGLVVAFGDGPVGWLGRDDRSFAVYCLLGLVAALALAAGATRRGYRAVLLALAGSFLAVLAGGRSAPALAGLAALALCPAGALFHTRPGRGAFLSAAALAAIAGWLVAPEGLERLDPGRTGIRAQAALDAVREEPLLGLGTGALEPVHDAYLQAVAELGPLGLALLVTLLGLAAWSLVATARRAREGEDRALERGAWTVLAGLGAYAAAGVFLSNQLGLALWTLIGLAVALDARAAGPAGGARAGPDYDPAVRERLLEQRERRLAGDFDAVRAERERLARLDEVVASRLSRTEKPAAEPDPEPGRLSALADRERALVLRHSELADRSRKQEAREVELDERSGLLARREAALARSAAEVARRAATVEEEQPVTEEPMRPPEPPPAQAAGPAARGAFNLPQLERLVAAHAAARPDDERLEEWRYYLLYLRDYSDVQGSLPARFDSLVDDVFAELL